MHGPESLALKAGIAIDGILPQAFEGCLLYLIIYIRYIQYTYRTQQYIYVQLRKR